MEGVGLIPNLMIDSRRRIDNAMPSNNQQGRRDALSAELWHACAGSSIQVPVHGEKVYYFLQGHMEQVESITSLDGDIVMPKYNLPPKILCEVVNVDLKAEAHNDEVFAQITLLPVEEREFEASVSAPQRTCARSFSKTLTPSDTNTHGGFSIPKRYADECLPPLDLSQQPPVQELVAKDLHGSEWHFRHIFRGQPKRHLLTSGWSLFVASKKLVTGDTCIFVRGENGELRVGIRRAFVQNNASTSLISGQSIQHGILASAYHAISTGSLFTVYYRPWTSPCEFIIPRGRYIKSVENDCSVGTRIKMKFEGEDPATHRLAGTIVGIEDIDCVRWPGSEWRCLKVQWDATSDTSRHSERVSPWDIEHIVPTNRKHTFVLPRGPQPKRPRVLEPSLPRFPILPRDGFYKSSMECPPQMLPPKQNYASQRHSGVLQGQEMGATGSHESGPFKPPMSQYLVPPNPDLGHSQMGLENQPQFPIHEPYHPYSGSTMSIPVTSGNSNFWPPILTSQGAYDNVGVSGNLFVPNVNSNISGLEEWRASEQNDDGDVHVAQPNEMGKFMLFGVNLTTSSAEFPSIKAATSIELQSAACTVPPTSRLSSETIHVSHPSKSTAVLLSEKQCKNLCLNANRSCTKVIKYGCALGRSVDLSRLNGYDELIRELDQMFGFEGRLIDKSSGWNVTYLDVEGDLMLVGDYPWQEFRSMVKRLFVYPKERVNELNPRSPENLTLA